MTDKQRILSEIERKYNEWKLGNSAEAKYRSEAYKELIELIKPMQEEPVSKDLEKTSYDFACRYHPLKTEYSTSSPNPEIIKAFKAGAKWQKEQLKNSAIDATIGYWNHRELSIDVKLPKDLKEGSKCKILIIKDK